MASRHALLLACVGGALLWALCPASSWAQAECSYQRYVVLRASAELSDELVHEVRKDLAAELSPRGFGVCAAPAEAGELAADIALSLPDASQLSIAVDDHTTGKRVARDVSLSRIPQGGKALAIAIATDELLRASWAELMLRRDQPPVFSPALKEGSQLAPRFEPQRLPVSARRSARWQQPGQRRPFALSSMLSYMHTSRALHGFGLDVRANAHPFGWGWFALGVGGLLALPVDTRSGVAEAHGLSAALTMGGCARERHRLTLCGAGRATLHWTRFRGVDPRMGEAEALQSYATALVTTGVAHLAVRLQKRVSLLTELGLGGAPLAARATDDGRTILGIDGLVLSWGLGVGLSL